MSRALLLLGLWIGSLWAGEYFACCEEKNRLAIVQANGYTFYAVGPDRLLHVGPLPRGLSIGSHQWRILRHDPLFGLTLYEAPHDAWPLDFRAVTRVLEHPERLSVVQPEGSFQARFGAFGESFYPASLDRTVPDGAVVCAPCYAVVGLGFGGGFIESDLLTHFIHFEGEDFGWGDLGFRLGRGSNQITSVTPFFENNPFAYGDRIVAMDNRELNSSAAVNRAVMVLPPGQVSQVEIEREGQRMRFEARAATRMGGGRYADTFLEHLGWRLDESLTIQVLVHEDVVGRGAMRVGDQLIQINNQVVTDPQSAMEILSEHEGPVKLLLSRDNFHFFIQLGEREVRLEDILRR